MWETQQIAKNTKISEIERKSIYVIRKIKNSTAENFKNFSEHISLL